MFEEYERFSRSNSAWRQLFAGLKALAYPACLVVGLGLMPLYGVASGFLGGRTVQTRQAPVGEHQAKLLKTIGLGDFNFVLTVDGERVYVSPDHLPLLDGSYRETIVWDTTGRVIVFEMMGKRVFAYDVVAKRQLGKGELKQFRLWPSPSDQYYAEIRDIDE